MIYEREEKNNRIVRFFCIGFQQERLDIEEKYSSLQEEVAGKTKKLKRVWTMLMQAKSEVSCTLDFFSKYVFWLNQIIQKFIVMDCVNVTI